MNRLPRPARVRANGPKPAPHSKLKLELIEAVQAMVRLKLIDASAGFVAISRLAPMNRAAVRRVKEFANRRNWGAQRLVVDLTKMRSAACHE